MDREYVQRQADAYQRKADVWYDEYQLSGMQRHYTAYDRARDMAEALRMGIEADKRLQAMREAGVD